MQILKTLFFSIFILGFAPISRAEEIVIKDSAGIVRHVSELQSPATIRFTVTDPDGKPLDGAVVNLTSKDLIEKRQGISVAGVVEFPDVAAGEWIVSTESSKLLFTQIEVAEFGTAVASMGNGAALGAAGTTATAGSGAGAGLSTTALVGTGILAAGGIAGMVIAIDQSGSNDKSEMSPAS